MTTADSLIRQDFLHPPSWLKPTAIITGLLGLLLFMLTPFMPVNQVQSSLSWPQGEKINSVNAPLESYVPEQLEATVPLAAIDELREGQRLLLGTLPVDAEKASARGLFVRSIDGGLDVTVRNDVLLHLSKEEVAALPDEAKLEISSTHEATEAKILDTYQGSVKEDKDGRPQVMGVYTEIESDATSLIGQGLDVDMEINSRFTSSPSAAKYATMWGGAILMLASLYCLWRIDRLDGRGRIAWVPRDRFKPTLLDALIGTVLFYWYVFGANTSDDGFILTMARQSAGSTYMANYYRWFGVPESPFGAPYYDLLALMAKISTASPFMRLPSLIAALCIWFAISRMALPFLGKEIDQRRVAHWTAGLLFLAFWLPYNNGLRPEPIIAFGALATWIAFERAIATQRLFPAAMGTIIAAFTLACGPTGLMAVAALLAGLTGVLKIMLHRVPSLGSWAWVAMLPPFFAAGTSVLVAVFGDQTLMTVLESASVRAEKGPSLKWYQELARYQVLFEQTVDGSFARRVPFVFAMISLMLVGASVLRNRKVPGSNRDVVLRLVLTILGTMFFMMFTPTKWTHHFGVYAGIGAALGGVAAVALSQFALQSKRMRILLNGLMLFAFAISLSAWNGWWYTGSYSIPWFDKTIQINDIEAGTVVLFIALAVLFWGVLQSFRQDLRMAKAAQTGEESAAAAKTRKEAEESRFTGLFAAPIAVLCAVTVAFSCASFAKAFAQQYPAYTVGLGNLRALGGDKCALANDALVETNTNDSFLEPVDTALKDSLDFGGGSGFDANGIPLSVAPKAPTDGTGTTALVSVAEETTVVARADTTDGGLRATAGVNGSRAELPFDLDPDKVPVLGSFRTGEQVASEATTAWYRLPERSENAPLLVVSAAGRIEHYDINNILMEGQKVLIEYGHMDSSGQVSETGELMPIDIGPDPAWRNLRLPLADLPESANVVRIVVKDTNLAPFHWVAFTPPRVPELTSLNEYIEPDTPGLLDWHVGLQFPCQRTFNHYAGVAEIPKYHITADYLGKSGGQNFQDWIGGGASGTAEAMNSSYQLPSYLKQDWNQDWGSLEIFVPRSNSLGEVPDTARIDTEVITRSGLWYPGPMNIETQ